MPIALTASTTSIGAITDAVGDMFEAGMTMAGTVGTTVVNNPLLLVFVVVPLVGLGIGIFRRLLNL